VIRLANAALDDVRRRTQQTSTGHRGRMTDPPADACPRPSRSGRMQETTRPPLPYAISSANGIR